MSVLQVLVWGAHQWGGGCDTPSAFVKFVASKTCMQPRKSVCKPIWDEFIIVGFFIKYKHYKSLALSTLFTWA